VGKTIPVFLILATLVTWQTATCAADVSTRGPEDRNRDLSISDALLYDNPIREVDRMHGSAGVWAVLDTLKNRAIDNDTRSLGRLFEIYFTSDGYVTEGVLTNIGEVYKAKPALVVEQAASYDSPKRDLIYKGVISNVHYGQVFEGEYPGNIEELRAIGGRSERFLQMYDYYLKHPMDIEDWSVNPPE
jgi:hypothetical protein